MVSATASTNSGLGETLDLKKLKDMLRDCQPYLAQDRPWEPWPRTLFGMDIIEHEERYEPVLRIRDDVPCTDKVRREVNDYLLKTFGTRDISVIPKGIAYRMFDKLVIRRDDLLAIRCVI